MSVQSYANRYSNINWARAGEPLEQFIFSRNSTLTTNMCAELMKREMTKPCFQFLEGCFKGGVIKILIDKLVHMQYKNNYVQR